MTRIEKSGNMPENATSVLDHGFVDLVDQLGTDLTIINSARVSFGKRAKEFADADKKLVEYLAKHKHHSPFRHGYLQFHIKAPEFVMRQWYKHCYSDDTEVLTKYGWKFWEDVTTADELANVTEDGKFYFKQPTEVTERDFVGWMYKFQSHTVDLCVTDEHRMYVQPRRYDVREKNHHYGDFEIRHAKDCIRGELRMPLTPQCTMPEGDNRDYLRGFLYGFALADGNFTSSANRIYFDVKKDRKRGAIYLLRKELPDLDWRDHNARTGYIKVSCQKPCIDTFVGIAQEKYINFDYLVETVQSFQGFLDGIMDGDGTVTPSGTDRITTSSWQMTQDLEKLCLYLGRTVKTCQCNKGYTVTIHQRKHANLHCASRHKVPYDGKVYCATVETGLLLVRRNGVVSVCGNCIGCEWTSGEGRFADHGWNEISGRYVEYDAEFYVPESFRPQAQDNKQASEEGDLGNSRADVCLEGYGDVTVKELYEISLQQSYDNYRHLLDAGVSKEQARCLLPVCFYTEIYWTVSLQAVAHFCKLRKHAGAQYEIQEYATAVEDLASSAFPITFKALMEYF